MHGASIVRTMLALGCAFVVTVNANPKPQVEVATLLPKSDAAGDQPMISAEAIEEKDPSAAANDPSPPLAPPPLAPRTAETLACSKSILQEQSAARFHSTTTALSISRSVMSWSPRLQPNLDSTRKKLPEFLLRFHRARTAISS